MKRTAFLTSALLVAVLVTALGGIGALSPRTASAAEGRITQGQLIVADDSGKPIGVCPLEHTDVKASISGLLTRVTVTQVFGNPYDDPIEAVYTFPLPQAAAVDRMTLKSGERVIQGIIKRREEARQIYEDAKAAGKVASLLDQERANIFTQSVANILPGNRIEVQISYVQTLPYENGSYRFVFPTVVGPRYMPGSPVGKKGGGRLPDTDKVPDASKISPPVAAEGMRAGHDISIEVALDMGVALKGLRSTNHEVETKRDGESRATVKLTNKGEIPNRDFVLDLDVAGDSIDDALLTYRDGGSGYFAFLLQPPAKVTAEDVTPKELVFVLDTSGSMYGFPMDKAKEAMSLAMDGLYPEDTFNLITFAGDTYVLFPQPVRATPENLALAKRFLESRQGGGGTEMMTAIRTALEPSNRQDHVRIVCFMTDGYIGNDMEVIGEVKKYPNARVFSFGIGSSVNRYLLDKMAEEGRGEVEYVGLDDDGSAAAKRFHERVRSPLLTDVQIDWGGLPVADVYPKRIPDVFSAEPVVISGRFTSAAKGTIKLKGNSGGKPFERVINVDLPERRSEHDVLGKLWARTRIDDLMSQDYAGAQSGDMDKPLQESITQVGLEFSLMTQFTSFVAVEDRVVTEGGQTRTVQVPVEMPDGVDRSMTVDEEKQELGKFKGRGGGGGGGDMRPMSLPTSPPKSAREPVSGAVDGISIETDKPATTAVANKTDGRVRDLINALESGNASPAATFVEKGRAKVKITLARPIAKGALKRLGVEVISDPDRNGVAVVWVRLDKLRKLVEDGSVLFVAAA